MRIAKAVERAKCEEAKARSGTREKRGNFDGKVLSRIANGISFTRFVLLLSWLPMFENVKVITQKGENYILALVSKQI